MYTTKKILPEIKNIMVKSATELDPDECLTMFWFLNIGPHCENVQLYDIQTKRKLGKYPQNVKPGMKAKPSAIDQFFMYLSWLRNGFPITLILWFYDTRNSLFFKYYIRWTNLLLWEYCYMAKHSKLEILLLNAL